MKKTRKILLTMLSVLTVATLSLGIVSCKPSFDDSSIIDSSTTDSSTGGSSTGDSSTGGSSTEDSSTGGSSTEDSSTTDSSSEDTEIIGTEGVIYQIPFGCKYAEVIGYEDTATEVTIASTYNALPVKSIASQAFYRNKTITSVIIPDGVTSIGDGAFGGCSSLESITIPFVGAKAGVTSNDTYQYPLGYIFGTSSYKGSTATEQYYHGSSTNSTTSTTYYIPSSLKNVTVTGGNILYGAFNGCSSLTSVVIPDSVTSIGEYAFSGCSSLTSVTIPDSVTSIGSGAFRYCSNLTSVVIGSNVTTIYNEAFKDCSSLTSVTIPDGLTSIGSYVFKNCSSLTFQEYGNCQYLGNEGNPYVALMQAKNTDESSYTIHEDTKVIAEWAFDNCGNMSNIVIPDGVTSIGHFAFYNCSSLTSVEIPDSVASIGGHAFENCKISSLTCSIKALSYFSKSNLTTVVITSGDSIGDSTFYNCSNLTSVEIPDSVTSIGKYAFRDCTGLTRIEIPDSVTSIGDGAFGGCSSLESITIPFVGAKAGVTSNDTYQYPLGYIFGTSSYKGSTATEQYYDGSSTRSTTYYIPSSLKNVTVTGGNILYGAFYNCWGLKSIVIPESVTSIGEYAFYYCSSLTSVTIPDSVTSIGKCAFTECRSLTSVTIPDSVTSIGSSAFDGCSRLTRVYITDIVTWCKILFDGSDANPLYHAKNLYLNNELVTEIRAEDLQGVTSIGSYAFYNCSSLTGVVIPDSVTSIGEAAFYNCNSLRKVNITDIAAWCNIIGLSNLMGYASSNKTLYLNNELVTELVIPDSVTSIGEYAFSGCDSLTSVVIGNSVTSIGGAAFYECSSLTSVVIGNSVTSIGGAAFYECSSLTSVVIPDSVTSIGSSAFAYCSSLASVVIPDSVTSIGSSAFAYCSSLASVVIPDSVTSIGAAAFSNCKSLTSVYYKGTATEWGAISIDSSYNGNSYLMNATRYYYSETEPTEEGKYWHYVDGVPTVW